MLDPFPSWKHAARSWPLIGGIGEPRKVLINRVSWFTGRTWMLPITGKTLKLKLMAAEASVDSECAQRWHKTHRATNYPSRKVVHVQSHTKPPTTGVQKSLVSSISCMKCELSDYTARGFWASDVQRCSVTSLDSKKTWIPRCRRPLALQPKQPQII